MLLMETGCSRSELLGLRFEDFDAEHGILHINQGLVSVNSKDGGETLIADGLKNGYRHREIPILEPRLLARLKAEPKTITISSGENERIVKAEYIFHSPEGKAYIPRNWYEREYKPFMRALVKAHPKIPLLTPHETAAYQSDALVGAGRSAAFDRRPARTLRYQKAGTGL